MRYTIEYEEIIRKDNSITIEVDDEDEGEEIVDELAKKVSEFYHPDDIFDALYDMGVEVIQTCEGAEDCEYEIL